MVLQKYKDSQKCFIDVQPVKGKLIPLKGSAKKKIVRSVNEFCQNSTIHGIRYLVEKSHMIERIFWIFALCLSIYLCIGLIRDLWLKWRENPVIISFDHQAMSIAEVPFPALTICPLTKATASKFNYTRVYRSIFKLDGKHPQTITEEELRLMKMVCLICDDLVANDVFDYFPDNYSDNSIINTFNNVMPKLEETMVFCKLFDKWSTCEKLLFPMVTEEGICFTFNAISFKEMATNVTGAAVSNMTYNDAKSDWDYENGYGHPKEGEPYPYHVFGTGKQASFSILMRSINQDIDYLCGGASQGFKLAFHAPNERPQIWKNFFHISPGKTASFTVDPRLIITSRSMKRYGNDVRQCFFNSERKLRFFKQYNKKNCEEECQSNFTKIQCGCVRFSMPRSDDTKICGPAKMRCCNQADNMIYYTGNFDACNCLPSCTSISYDVDTSQAEYDLLSPWSLSNFQQTFDFENSTFSRVIISFKDEHFTASRRTEFRSITDFLSNLGGAFGLFMGASLLSLVELIYYFTLRIFYMQNEQQVIRYRGHKNQTRIFTVLP